MNYRHGYKDDEMTTKEFTAATGLSKKTVYRWLKKRWLKEPDRNVHGWYIWTQDHVRIAREIMKPYPPVQLNG